MEEIKAEQIIKEVKNIDDNVTSIIVPLLKDTIEDYRKIMFKLILIIALLIISIVGTSIYSVYQYNDFLSQFEYESEEIYQTIDGGDGINSTINDGIEIIN